MNSIMSIALRFLIYRRGCFRLEKVKQKGLQGRRTLDEGHCEAGRKSGR